LQVICERLDDPKVHFEALPSEQVTAEMAAFVDWFNRTETHAPDALPPLIRAGTVLAAVRYSRQQVEFLIGKTRLYDQVRGKLNPRQEKVVARLFAEGIGGFHGGMSAKNYLGLTKTSRATATRDLQEFT
jgi:Fic family protein